MKHVDFMQEFHIYTSRDYLARVNGADKSECAIKAKEFGYDYWDGERKYGYGGYAYDGRWRPIAEKLARYYGFKAGDKVLDIGCGKAHLLYELTQVVPDLYVQGVDISDYALENAKEEVKPYLQKASAVNLPFEDASFDFIVSLSTLHNLYIYDLQKALQEINRVGKKNSYIMVEAYRNEREKMNLLYWQLTCECFFSKEEWEWLYKTWNYQGDYSFIYFE